MADTDEIFDGDEHSQSIENGEEEESELEQFLIENKLDDIIPLLKDQQIDFDALLLLTEPDLKSLNLPLGPYRKLVNALKKKRNELSLDDDKIEKNDESQSKDAELALDDGNGFRVVDESGEDSEDENFEIFGKKKEDLLYGEINKNHPYRYELDNFKPPEGLLQSTELEDAATLEDTKYEFINDDRRLRNLVKTLRNETVLCVDFKFTDNDYEPNLQIFQISSPTTDYLIDFSKMDRNTIILTDLFVNPNITKVFYDAKTCVKLLQSQWKLFTVNAFCVQTALKEAGSASETLQSILIDYAPYSKLHTADFATRPLSTETKHTLRKETHFLLHTFFKTKNQLIEAGKLDNVIQQSKKYTQVLFKPNFPRTPENLFNDYDMFNDAQKECAENLNEWREGLARSRNLNPNTIVPLKRFKLLCLCLPSSRDDVLACADTKFLRMHVIRILTLIKESRKKYDKEEKDSTKYSLFEIPKPKDTEIDGTIKRKREPSFGRSGPSLAIKKTRNVPPPRRSMSDQKTFQKFGGRITPKPKREGPPPLMKGHISFPPRNNFNRPNFSSTRGNRSFDNRPRRGGGGPPFNNYKRY